MIAGSPPARPAARRAEIAPFIVMEVMRAANERAADGSDILHLEVGQPSTAAPAAVRAAARAAIDGHVLGYTDALGLPALRRRIARHYADSYGQDVDWRRIVITTGSSGAFVLAFLAAFDAGDRVVVAEPGYPCYRNILQALGVTAVPLPCSAATRHHPTPDLLDGIAGRIDGLILASPANPTGSMLAGDALRRLAAYAEARRLVLISDEIYHGITYGERAETVLGVAADAVVINSFSKYYSMTGWRLGWMVVPERLLRPIERLAQNLYIAPPSVSQYAAIEAFACGEELDRNVARYARNRALLLEGLPKAGVTRFAAADGAFYLYADVSDFGVDSRDLCRRILAETGVAITPGIDFDPTRGGRFVRISFSGTEADVAEAVARLIAWTSRASGRAAIG